MASTAIRIVASGPCAAGGPPRKAARTRPDERLGALGPLDDLPAAVVAALGAGAVRELRLAAVRAGGGGGLGEGVVRPPAVAARLGMAPFGVRHGRRASSWVRSAVALRSNQLRGRASVQSVARSRFGFLAG